MDKALKLEIPDAVEGDSYLSMFLTYGEYLDALVTSKDLHYLRCRSMARKVASLGYRCAGETITQQEFKKRRERVLEQQAPLTMMKTTVALSLPTLGRDPLVSALAVREDANRNCIIVTIVYLRFLTKKSKKEISGFVDFSARLSGTDMTPFFKGVKLLLPLKTDLGFFNFQQKISITNSSAAIESLVDPQMGLLFRHKEDHLFINPSLSGGEPGPNTYKQFIGTPRYLKCVVYDHLIRRKSIS